MSTCRSSTCPASGYADALGVMLLSGDIPDLIYFQGGDQKMAEQGILEDLTPWIEKTTEPQGRALAAQRRAAEATIPTCSTSIRRARRSR